MALSAIGNAPPQDERTPQLCPSAETKKSSVHCFELRVRKDDLIAHHEQLLVRTVSYRFICYSIGNLFRPGDDANDRVGGWGVQPEEP